MECGDGGEGERVQVAGSDRVVERERRERENTNPAVRFIIGK